MAMRSRIWTRALLNFTVRYILMPQNKQMNKINIRNSNFHFVLCRSCHLTPTLSPPSLPSHWRRIWTASDCEMSSSNSPDRECRLNRMSLHVPTNQLTNDLREESHLFKMALIFPRGTGIGVRYSRCTLVFNSVKVSNSKYKVGFSYETTWLKYIIRNVSYLKKKMSSSCFGTRQPLTKIR